MRSLFMTGGSREKALQFLLERGEKIIGVLTPPLTKTNDRFLKVVETALKFEVPVFPITRETLKSTVMRTSPDVLISCGFPYLIDKEIRDSVAYAINVHPTLLPKYRGFRSGPYVIMNGESHTGVTIHFLEEGVDSGDIILQEKVELSRFDTTRSMQRKTSSIEGSLLHKALSMLKRGQYKCHKQDESRATTYLKCRTPVDSYINWKRPLRELYDQIRACDPDLYPAYFYVDEKKVCIRLWRPEKAEDEADMI